MVKIISSTAHSLAAVKICSLSLFELKIINQKVFNGIICNQIKWLTQLLH